MDHFFLMHIAKIILIQSIYCVVDMDVLLFLFCAQAFIIA